jgi:hypothetical protein
LRHEQNGAFQLAARFCVTIRLMREGPSNQLAGAGLKPPSADAPLRGVVVSGEGKGPEAKLGSGDF